MAGLGSLLKSLFGGRSGAHDQAALAELRTRLAARFLGYRNLLKANSRALTIMAELQEAQQSPEPVTMARLRSAATEMAVSVLAMIQELDGLAPGRYPAPPGSDQSGALRISTSADASCLMRRMWVASS